MKVTALKSFFGSGVNARKGKALDVDDALAKSWIEAGLVEAEGNSSTSTAKDQSKATTTSSTVDRDTTQKTQPKPLTDEKVADQKTETESTQTKIGDVKKETVNETTVKSDDLKTSEVKPATTETVKADENIKTTNTTKESK